MSSFHFLLTSQVVLYHSFPPSLHTRAQGESTPSAAFDVDASYAWNSLGDGLLMEALDFPVVLVTGDSVAEVLARSASNGPLGKPTQHKPIYDRHTRKQLP